MQPLIISSQVAKILGCSETKEFGALVAVELSKNQLQMGKIVDTHGKKLKHQQVSLLLCLEKWKFLDSFSEK